MAGLFPDKKVKLATGSVLTLRPAPFADSKALYQAVLGELNKVGLSKDMEVLEAMKQVFCGAFSSPVIEAALWKCMERSLYNDQKITQDLFDNIQCREDYVQVCLEVGIENVAPFLKNLSAAFSRAQTTIEGFLGSK